MEKEKQLTYVSLREVIELRALDPLEWFINLGAMQMQSVSCLSTGGRSE